MSSIRLLHRSSLSLLPLQCCNCNNFIAYILLLITSLLSTTLCAIYKSVSKKNNNNNRSCLYHHNQDQRKDSCNHPLALKSSNLDHFYCYCRCLNQLNTTTAVSTRGSVNQSTVTDCQTSDTYILTPLTTAAKHSASSNCSSSSISWNCSESDGPLPITRNRHSQQYSHKEEQQVFYQSIDCCCANKSKNKNICRSSIRSSVHNRNIDSDCYSPKRALYIRSNTNTYTRQLSSHITTSSTPEEAEITATVIVPTLVDLTHPSLHPTLTPNSNGKNSPLTSKHLTNNNNNKPFFNPSAQRLISSSSTPLLQENQQSTHSNSDFGVSTSLHVLVQQRKSKSQPRKPQQNLRVGIIKYA
ncbi:uncharacterized protein LOC118743168 [Rhagoletis pomonella]|uniref:uncharacterized protein LOC118743168 n=1 Tax=Rhagoletis pomonella TaxID=28610 RepID=UPI00177F8BC8|nr:uncharacterized protein LOC118743168 [Rhagoletis pomonella]